MNTYTPKQYTCSGAPGHIHTVYTLTEVLEDNRYDDDRASISLLQPGGIHTDADGDTWTRVS